MLFSYWCLFIAVDVIVARLFVARRLLGIGVAAFVVADPVAVVIACVLCLL